MISRDQTKWHPENVGIDWPSHSPDLAVLDFSINDYVKNEVWAERPPSSIDELKVRVKEEVDILNRPEGLDYLKRSIGNLKKRLEACKSQNGYHTIPKDP